MCGERTSKIYELAKQIHTPYVYTIISNVEFNFLIEQIKTWTFLALPAL